MQLSEIAIFTNNNGNYRYKIGEEKVLNLGKVKVEAIFLFEEYVSIRFSKNIYKRFPINSIEVVEGIETDL